MAGVVEKIDCITDILEIEEMNRIVHVKINRGLIQLAGMKNQLFVDENYGLVENTGMKTTVTIQNNHATGWYTNIGNKSELKVINQAS